MASVWSCYTEENRFDSLKENIKTDVLIIGGGMAGILCAYMLKQSGVDCVLVEADRICGGVTHNTTAKLTFQHGLIYDKLVSRFGTENAALYLSGHKKALEEYRRLSQEHECDYEIKDSYVYSKVDRKKIEREAFILNTLGVNAEVTETLSLPFKTVGAVKIGGEAQFNPLKFAFSIAKNLPIYENTKIRELREGRAITDSAEITYKKIIVATHFPFINKHGFYFLKMFQHRSYVLALEGAADVDGMYVDENDKGLSFRNYKNLLFVGGGGHRTGKKGGSYSELRDFSSVHYPDAKEVSCWATQDCMTLDGMAYIGQYSKNTPDMYVATGFNKWGMSSSMLSAMILSDMICGKRNEYEKLFSPQRNILYPQLAVNLFESVLGLVTPTVPRCPHLGCALKYNAAEHSWDCSCHGSRFSESGEVINNPATADKKNMPGKRE